MSVQAINRKYQELINTVGRSALNAIFPYDFEVYMMALELTDSNGNMIDYISFPIMPESITKNEPKRTNIKNTSSGITILNSATYAPEEITIKGNFGRNFKILLSPKEPSATGVAFSTNAGIYALNQVGEGAKTFSFRAAQFNVGIKTGYGATKMLQSIVSKSNGIDSSGQPFRLYFYNLALGESYLVSVPASGLTLTQNRDKNMIWEYSLTLNAIAPLNSLKTQAKATSLVSIASVNSVQKGVYATVSTIQKTIFK
jgi:hypothetical protein